MNGGETSRAPASWARARGRLLTGAALLCAATSLLTPACGVRTEPRPPEDTAARAPDDFEARLGGGAGAVELRWERPTKTVDGGRLYDLASFAVERRSADGAFETIATIGVTDTDRLRTQRTFRYVDPQAPAGDVEYRVRAVTADGEAGVPSTVNITVSPAAGGGQGENTDDESEPATRPHQ